MQPVLGRHPQAQDTAIDKKENENDTCILGASLLELLLEQQPEEVIVFDESSLNGSLESSSSWSDTSQLSLSSIDTTTTTTTRSASMERDEQDSCWNATTAILEAPPQILSHKQDRRSTQVKVDGMIRELQDEMKRVSQGLETAFHPKNNSSHGEEDASLELFRGNNGSDVESVTKQAEEDEEEEDPSILGTTTMEEEDDTNSIGGNSLLELQTMLRDATAELLLLEEQTALGEDVSGEEMGGEIVGPKIVAQETEAPLLYSGVNPQDDTGTVLPVPEETTVQIGVRNSEAFLVSKLDRAGIPPARAAQTLPPKTPQIQDVMTAAAELLEIDLTQISEDSTSREFLTIAGPVGTKEASHSSNHGRGEPQFPSIPWVVSLLAQQPQTPTEQPTFSQTVKQHWCRYSSFLIPACALASVLTSGSGLSMSSSSTGNIIFFER